MKPLLAALTGLVLVSCATPAPPAPPEDPAAGVDGFLNELGVAPASAEAVTARCDQFLARGQRLRTALETASGPASVDVDFQHFDTLSNVLNSGVGEVQLISETNPSAEIRTVGEACIQRLTAALTEIGLSRPIYDRLVAIPAEGVDAPTQFVLTRALDDYRRAGVDRDEATRNRVLALSNEITEIGLTFSRNIREDASEATFPSVAALEGLPADYIDQHQPGADGRVHIATQYPDVFPIMNYARRESTRRAVLTAFENRAYPANDAVLRQLIEKRHELATLLGRQNYAELNLEDRMAKTPARVSGFIDELAGFGRPSAQRDVARQLQRLRRIDRRAQHVPLWSRAYVDQLIRTEQYNVDPQQVRRYFAYNNVRDGMLRLVSDLFGVEFRPWANAPVWHESVEAFEVYDQGRLIGRIFLDMHPREGKFSHAAAFPLRTGLAGRSVPVGALICNFPAGGHDTGLMEHGDVETFLHEFGHLIHALFSGEKRWSQQAGFEVEWDFVEAPSTLLEEWVWDYDTLARFAVNAEGQTIPRDLVERMNRARFFGGASGTLRQLGLSSASLAYYSQPPAGMDLLGVYRTNMDRYAMWPTTDGRNYANWGHLVDYGAAYYTYEWSSAIALDLFTQFQSNGLRDPATARRYRELVLAPGGGKPADTLIQDFLGRPLRLDAYRERLEK